jgi:LysM repeat protein
VNRQVRVAKQHDYTFLRTTKDVRKFIDMGLLVRVPGNAHYTVDNETSFPYARPAVKLFIERLSRQYHNATGQKLVITSMTRPKSRQPRNASQNSVHPTGMAIDIQRSHSKKARTWLETTLLTLERRGVVEATRERHPPHYHVAVFPNQYEAYVENKLKKETPQVASKTPQAVPPKKTGGAGTNGGEVFYTTYRVQRGDSLWTIAKNHRTSVDRLRNLNAMDSARIYPGQTLMVPETR